LTLDLVVYTRTYFPFFIIGFKKASRWNPLTFWLIYQAATVLSGMYGNNLVTIQMYTKNIHSTGIWRMQREILRHLYILRLLIS